jgi:hypothetical protein
LAKASSWGSVKITRAGMEVVSAFLMAEVTGDLWLMARWHSFCKSIPGPENEYTA